MEGAVTLPNLPRVRWPQHGGGRGSRQGGGAHHKGVTTTRVVVIPPRVEVAAKADGIAGCWCPTAERWAHRGVPGAARPQVTAFCMPAGLNVRKEPNKNGTPIARIPRYVPPPYLRSPELWGLRHLRCAT